MTKLTQDIQCLMLHAKFEEVCALAPCKEAILILCAKICEADPEFFTDNGAFEPWYEDGYSEYSDFDLMVEALKDLHGARLQIDDGSSFFYSMMNRYAVPELNGEKRWGDAVHQVLNVLVESVGFAVTMYTNTDEVRLSQSPLTDSSIFVEAECMEVVALGNDIRGQIPTWEKSYSINGHNTTVKCEGNIVTALFAISKNDEATTDDIRRALIESLWCAAYDEVCPDGAFNNQFLDEDGEILREVNPCVSDDVIWFAISTDLFKVMKRLMKMAPNHTDEKEVA